MLDSLIDGIKGQVISTIIEKTGLGANEAEQAIPLAKDSISDGITSAISGGNVGGILDMLKGATGGDASSLMQNMVYKGIAGNFIGSLTSKLGVPEGMAATVSSLVLPMIMNRIGGAAAQDGDSDDIDQGSIMNVLGLDTGSLLGKAAGLLGGKDGGLGGAIGGMFK